jgi:pseudaminic acid biosynthesis-associated methylase
MGNYKTEQEQFWTGEFGDSYVQRNQGANLLPPRLALFSKIIARTRNLQSVLEFGANIGLNMHALRALKPKAELSAIEINAAAVEELRRIEGVKAYHQSILEFEPDYERDFVFTKGVLIHINPDALPAVYEKLYRSSRRYVCVIEYYDPNPVMVPYRGHGDRLFKRDFAGEMMDAYPDLTLLDYGFTYHRDPNFPQDDGTWFLMEKTGGN